MRRFRPPLAPPNLGGEREDQTSPVVVFSLLLEGEAEGGSLLYEHRAVGGVETAKDECGAWCHLLFEGRHIGQ